MLRYTYSIVLDLHQWKLRCLTNCELDRMQLVVICVFGTECYVHIPKQKKHKWDPKSMLGRLVSNIGEKDGYRIWMPNERKIALSRDILKPNVVCNSCNDVTQTKSKSHTPRSSSLP